MLVKHRETRPWFSTLLTRWLGVLVLSFLSAMSCPVRALGPAEIPAVQGGETELLDVEKDRLKFGFIKLTDCAPIVIAKEKGFFDDESFSVQVIAQPIDAAARLLVEEGHILENEIPWDTDGYKPATDAFIDGTTYDGKDPLGYLQSFGIGHAD